jgi:hypothetical protein
MSMQAKSYPPEQLRSFLDIQNVLLEPVACRQDDFPPFPPTPSPPSKAILKCNDRRRSAPTRSMLKIVALVLGAIFKKSAVEMIVQPFA